jgi:GDP-mannose transporter
MGLKFKQNFQAYGEVIWFGGKVTALTFVSFVLMVSRTKSILWLRNLIAEKVISSIIAAWSDVASGLSGSLPAVSTVSLNELQNLAGAVRGLNVGYFWMFVNCLTSAAYVRISVFVLVNDVNSFTIGAFHAETNQVYRIL